MDVPENYWPEHVLSDEATSTLQDYEFDHLALAFEYLTEVSGVTILCHYIVLSFSVPTSASYSYVALCLWAL